METSELLVGMKVGVSCQLVKYLCKRGSARPPVDWRRLRPAPPVSAFGPRNSSAVGTAPRPVIRSITLDSDPSLSMARLNTTTSAGTAQKSPHTHRMAAPICWSAKGESVTPGMWA